MKKSKSKGSPVESNETEEVGTASKPVQVYAHASTPAPVPVSSAKRTEERITECFDAEGQKTLTKQTIEYDGNGTKTTTIETTLPDGSTTTSRTVEVERNEFDNADGYRTPQQPQAQEYVA